MIRLAIDPGIQCFGAAVFENEWLKTARLCRNFTINERHETHATRKVENSEPLNAHRACVELITWLTAIGVARKVDKVLIEVPRIYPASQQKGDQNDLIALAGFAYALATCVHSAEEIVRFFPRDWKGTIDPDVMTSRIEARLAPAESASLEPCPKSLRHNMIDAVGIGLFDMGRLDRRRVIVR